jgi:hypothetical protein
MDSIMPDEQQPITPAVLAPPPRLVLRFRVHLTAKRYLGLMQAAKRREVDGRALAERIIETVLDNDLIDAVLDD